MQDREFMKSLLKAENLDEEVEIISEYLNDPIVVISPSLAIISHSKKRIVPDHAWQNAVHRGYITLEFGSSLSKWNSLKDKNQDYITVSTISQYRRRFFRLVYKNHTVGYLNVAEVDRSLDEIPVNDIDLVCAYMAHTIMEHQHVLIASGNRPEDILTELLQNSFIDRLHYLSVITGTIFETPAARKLACLSVNEINSYNADEDSLRNEISTILPGSTTAVLDQKLYILIPFLEQDKNEKMIMHLKKWLLKKHVSVGISDIFYDLYQIIKYQKQAEYALANIAEDSICFYEEVIVNDLLRHINEGEKNEYCCMSIRRIAQYDKEHHTNYFLTLEAWLKNNGRLKETSETLHMHRNSISYRLQKIQDEFHLNLNNQKMYLSWLVSCMILHDSYRTEDAGE